MNNDYDLIRAGEEALIGFEYILIGILIIWGGIELVPYVFLGFGLSKMTRSFLKIFRG